MKRARTGLAAVVVCSFLCALILPRARDAAAILAAQDSPVELADGLLDSALRNQPGVIATNIDTALAENDSDLAGSFLELARDRDIPVSEELSKRVSEAVAAENSSSHFAHGFASGLVTGNAEDVASISGTVAGDLFVFGDIRDVVREGKHLAFGEETDRLVLGLASAGIAVTAATYLTAGSATPVRAGLSIVKGARKAGRMSSGLVEWTGRTVRDAVDAPLLQNAVLSAPVTRPAKTVEAIKAAFRMEKGASIIRLGKDVSRVSS